MDSGPGRGYSPDGKFDNPEVLSQVLTSRVLPLVSRPARYIGGELGAPCPNWRPDRAKILLAFPDAYEIGMSHTGLRVLFSQINHHPQAVADFTFAPWPDMEDRMRREEMPLFGLLSRRPARQFDAIGFSLCYELTYTNLLTMLDLAGIPLLAADRNEDDPVIVAGGACTLNPHVIAPFVDLVFLGDGEEAVVDLVTTVHAARQDGGDRAALCERLAALDGAWRQGSGRVRSRVLADL